MNWRAEAYALFSRRNAAAVLFRDCGARHYRPGSGIYSSQYRQGIRGDGRGRVAASGSALGRGLSGIHHEVIYLPGGEDRKRLGPVEALAEEMVQRGADRSSMVIACGGGIVNDMAGFLAAIFMRGIPVLQVPTTLLAQVDAAIGGKTGVNLVSGKNLIGSFHQPLAVLIDPATLDTLPEREYRAGLWRSEERR